MATDEEIAELKALIQKRHTPPRLADVQAFNREELRMIRLYERVDDRQRESLWEFHKEIGVA